jgi:hypothetical protein
VQRSLLEVAQAVVGAYSDTTSGFGSVVVEVCFVACHNSSMEDHGSRSRRYCSCSQADGGPVLCDFAGPRHVAGGVCGRQLFCGFLLCSMLDFGKS